MARPPRDGIDYFPCDVGLLRDEKVKLIKGEFGAEGVLVYLHLLCSLYEDNGYYKVWSDDVCILVSEEVGCGCNFSSTAEIVKGLIRRSLFDSRVANTFGVLTSAGIQRRYLRAASQRDDIQIISDYWLLDLNNKNDVPARIVNKVTFKKVSTCGNPNKTYGNPVKTSDNPQSKGKERKVNTKDKNVCPERIIAPDPQRELLISLALKDGTEYKVQKSKANEWAELYPGVDVVQELRSMRGWLNANPLKRKTRRGIEKFINSWLSREQKEVGNKRSPAVGRQPGQKPKQTDCPQREYKEDYFDRFVTREFGSGDNED